jgi:hypothetical protein
MNLNPGGFAGAFLGSVLAATAAIVLVPYDPPAGSEFYQRMSWLLIGGLVVGATVCNLLWGLLFMQANEPMAEPVSTASPPPAKFSPAGSGLPWVWRIAFAAAGTLIIAEVFTRSRPDLRPAWLGICAATVELIVALWFLLIAISRPVSNQDLKPTP